MKLYTEEVIRNSMNSVKYYMEHYDASVIDRIIDNHVKALGPIELPSDEEILRVALKKTNGINQQVLFNNGAVYVCRLIEEQIKQQDNGK